MYNDVREYILFQEFRQMVPVGVIPTGKTNKFATYFFGSDKQKVRYMDTVYLFTLYLIHFTSISRNKRVIHINNNLFWFD